MPLAAAGDRFEVRPSFFGGTHTLLDETGRVVARLERRGLIRPGARLTLEDGTTRDIAARGLLGIRYELLDPQAESSENALAVARQHGVVRPWFELVSKEGEWRLEPAGWLSTAYELRSAKGVLATIGRRGLLGTRTLLERHAPIAPELLLLAYWAAYTVWRARRTATSV